MLPNRGLIQGFTIPQKVTGFFHRPHAIALLVVPLLLIGTLLSAIVQWDHSLTSVPKAFTLAADEDVPILNMRSWRPSELYFGLEAFYVGPLNTYLVASSIALAGLAGAIRLPAGPGKGHFLEAPEELRKVYRAGRMVSILSALGIIVGCYILGFRLYGPGVGLLAATYISLYPAFLSLYPHMKADLPVTLFSLLFLLLCLRLLSGEDPPQGRYAGIGLVGGLAVATKYNALLLVLPAILLAHWMRRRLSEEWASSFVQKATDRRLWLGIASLVLGFVLGNPYSVLDHKGFFSDLRGTPFSHLSASSTAFFVSFPGSSAAIGRELSANGAWLLALSALGGATLAGLRGNRRERFCALVLVLFLGQFLLSPLEKGLVRFFMPIVPLILLFAAYFHVAAWRRWGYRIARASHRNTLGGVLILLCLLPLGQGALNLLSLRMTDTHVKPEAFRWVLKNIPAGAHVGINRYEYPFSDPGLFPGLQILVPPEPSALGQFQFFISLTSDSRPQERDLLDRLMRKEGFVLRKQFEKEVLLLGFIRKTLPEMIAIFQRDA